MTQNVITGKQTYFRMDVTGNDIVI